MSSKISVGKALRRAAQEFSKTLPDEDVYELTDIFDIWRAGNTYSAGDIINHLDIAYRVLCNVTAIASHPPDSEGMLAVYRPIVPETHDSGTPGNPLPWIYGMDCVNGKVYLYKDKKYLCKSDMMPCIWPPDTNGMWQWELIG